jgi:hypothetical protein
MTMDTFKLALHVTLAGLQRWFLFFLYVSFFLSATSSCPVL